MNNDAKGTPIKFRMLNDTTPFAIIESFNQLRTNLMYTPKKKHGCAVYGITSAEAKVGKSTIVSNLAVSFAKTGKKVLLVDADMRRPIQNKIFNINKKQAGLSELLSDIVISDDTCIVHDVRPSLSVLTSGAIPPNPAELMLSENLSALIQKWRNEYDIVFIDLPPVGVVSDSLALTELVDGYILVAMANKSNAKYVNNAISSLEFVGGKITGIVVNRTSLKGDRNYKYDKKYGYGYGYGYHYTASND